MSDDLPLDVLLTVKMQARLAMALYGGRKAVHALVGEVRKEGKAATKVKMPPNTADHDVPETYCESKFFQLGHILAGALIFRDHVHIAVCGTNDISDLLDNLRARHFMGFHRGYSESVSHLWGEFAQQHLLDELKFRHLVLGGHSAGGAIAQLLSIRPHLQPREVITFGSPRAFSRRSAKAYKENRWETYRFVMSGDPFPYVPFRRFRCLFGRALYQHTAPATHLGDDGEVSRTDDSSKIRKVAGLVASTLHEATGGLAFMLGLLPWKIRRNHAMSRYAAAIDKAIERVKA